jgi:ribokinase
VVYAARLTVLGSLNMDISVTVPDLPVPGATVLGRGAVFAPGGKGANQAVAAARLARDAGMPVAMVGCTGDDDFGRTLREALQAEGIDDSRVRTVAGAPTGIAMITVDHAGENMITVAPGANHEVSTADAAAPVFDAAHGFRDVLVISAEVPIPVIAAALAESAGRALRVLNLAPAPSRAAAAELVAAGPEWLVVNESEAAAVLGRAVAGLAQAADAAADLVAAGAGNAVVTAGAAGAAYCGPQPPEGIRPAKNAGRATEAGRAKTAGPATNARPAKNAAPATNARPGVVTVPGFKVTAVDTVGAGDTFVGALAVALAAGVPPVDAVTAAAAAGAAAAARPGTQSGMPRPAEVLTATGHRWPVTTRSLDAN